VIFKSAKPSIVYIIGGDSSGNPTVQGSGFIIAQDEVVTNHHVVAGTSTAMAVFADGATAPVTKVLADSSSKDLIVLIVATGSRPPLVLGDELSLQQGDPVYAIGAPKGLELTLTDGIVSAFRNLDDQFLIQSTAAIGHGSSGGPLFDSNGKVVGITSSLMSDTPGIYFSESIGDLKRLLRNPQLITLNYSEWARDNSGTTASTDSAGSPPTPKTSAAHIQDLLNRQKFDEARSELDSLRRSDPDSPVTHRLVGELCERTGDTPGAIRELAIAVEKDPSDSTSEYYYALTLYAARRFDEALVHELKSYDLSPTADDKPILAVLYYVNDDFQHASDFATQSLTADAQDEMALTVATALSYHGFSSPVPWADGVSRLSSINKDNIWVHVANGFGDLKASQVEQATAEFKAAENSYFADSAAYMALIRLYADRNEFGHASDEVKLGLADDPDDLALLGEGIFVSLVTRDNTEASRRFERLQKIYPSSRQTLFSGCLYYYGVGQPADALPYCSRAVSENPSDRVGHSNYGWAALDANEFQTARSEFSQAYKLASPDWSKLGVKETIDLLWGSAMALYFSGDRKGAAEIVKFIRKSYPAYATVTGLQQLPLLWSTVTMQRIEAMIREFPK